MRVRVCAWGEGGGHPLSIYFFNPLRNSTFLQTLNTFFSFNN